MVSEAESHAEEAHRLREVAEARNAAETLAYATEKSLAENRDKIDEAEAATIEGRIMELKQALEGSDPEAINARLQELQQAAQPLAQAIYAQAQAGAAPDGGNGGTTTTPEGDEVVEDADYEVIDEDEAAKKA